MRFFSEIVAKSFDHARFLLPIISGLLAVSAGDIFARQIAISWNANTEPELGGYLLYYGLASRAYTSTIDVGNQTSYVLNVDDANTYYIAVTAYNINKTLESSFSNEVNTSSGSVSLAFQESPSEGSYESGVGLIRGWVCNASVVEVEIDGGERLRAAYGTRRADTASVCGTTDTGYGLTYNWNLLGDGIHTLRVLADGVEFDRVSFRVTTLGQDYLRNVPEYRRTLSNFPSTGRNTTLRWSETHQNFVIVGFE